MQFYYSLFFVFEYDDAYKISFFDLKYVLRVLFLKCSIFFQNFLANEEKIIFSVVFLELISGKFPKFQFFEQKTKGSKFSSNFNGTLFVILYSLRQFNLILTFLRFLFLSFLQKKYHKRTICTGANAGVNLQGVFGFEGWKILPTSFVLLNYKFKLQLCFLFLQLLGAQERQVFETKLYRILY